MTYGLTADIHAHPWSLFSKVDADGVNSRLVTIMDEFERAAQVTVEKGGKRLYVAGDLFHVRGKMETVVFNYVLDRLDLIASAHDVELRIMPGNHDLDGAEVTFLGNAVTGLGRRGITTVQRPTWFNDDQVAMVPWQNTRKGLMDAIEKLAADMGDAGEMVANYDLILHTGINGVIIGMPPHGWAPEELAGFGFKRVFSGHYHNHKVFDLVDSQVISIGASTHQTWSDVQSKAGFLTVGNRDFTFHDTKAPKFMDFDPLSDDLTPYIGNYVRVRGIELEEHEIKVLKTALTDMGVAGLVIPPFSRSKLVVRPGTTASAGKAAKVETSITDWIKASEFKHKEAVEKAALDILVDARSAE
ncbi:MAG: hypothetical protein LPK02_07360 [Rhodobacterales bacterium]|mgnify:CR=1 FL=1|nr:hypothetical protein [Rhodobacterales bacterium]